MFWSGSFRQDFTNQSRICRALHRVRHHVMVLLHHAQVLHRWTEPGGEIFMSTKKGREGFKLARWLSRWWFERFFDFTLILVEMIQFHEHIFQMGWFNHHSQELATRKISWDPKGSWIVSQPSIFQRLCSLVSRRVY